MLFSDTALSIFKSSELFPFIDTLKEYGSTVSEKKKGDEKSSIFL